MQLKQPSNNTLRTVHFPFSFWIFLYFWIIKMSSEEILRKCMGKWTWNWRLDCMPREVGRRWICLSFLWSITRLIHFKYPSNCAQGIYRVKSNIFSKNSFSPYIFLSVLSAITVFNAHARPPSCPKFLARATEVTTNMIHAEHSKEIC